MFNRKISKKLTNSQREAVDPTRAGNAELELRKIQAQVNQTRNPRYDLPEFRLEDTGESSIRRRSNSRIAAGFVPSDQPSSSRTQRRTPIDFSENDFPTERSNNEIQEEFDVDDDNFQYPSSGPLPAGLLLEEYNELVNDSADDVRTTDESQQRIPVPMSPQVSKVPFRAETIRQSRSQNSRTSSDKLSRRNSRSLPPKSSRITGNSRTSSKRIKEYTEEDEDGLAEDEDLEASSGYSNTNMDYVQPSLNNISRSNSRGSRRASNIFESSDINGPGGISLGASSSGAGGGISLERQPVNSGISLERQPVNSGISLERQPVNFGISNNRLNSNNPSLPNANMAARDVIPLPIEIPDTVTDADAFRRYLSVRRGAIFPTNTDTERGNLETLGGRANNPYPNGPPRTPSQMIPASFVSSSASLSPLRPSPPADLGPNNNQPPDPSSLNNPRGGLGPCMSRAEALGQGNKRTASLSHAIMTLALLSASAAQLRFVVAYSHAHAYPTLNYFLVCSCIIIEILVGIGFVVLARFDFTDGFQDKLHSYLIFGLFVITVANVIVAAFALDDHICEVLMKRQITEAAGPALLQQQQQQFQQPLFDDTRLNRYGDPI